MLEIELKSHDLKEFLYLKLGKNKEEALFDEDLNGIDELDLNKLDIIGEETDVTIEDIVFFNNLKNLYLSNFVLDDKCVSLINSRANLEFLQINNCIFQNNENLKVNAKHIAIIDSENIKLSKIEDTDNLEKLHIVNCACVDLTGISQLTNLKKVYLQNMDLNDLSEVVKIKGLVYLNLNGSQVEDGSFNENNYDFVIEHEEVNALYDSENE